LIVVVVLNYKEIAVWEVTLSGLHYEIFEGDRELCIVQCDTESKVGKVKVCAHSVSPIAESGARATGWALNT